MNYASTDVAEWLKIRETLVLWFIRCDTRIRFACMHKTTRISNILIFVAFWTASDASGRWLIHHTEYGHHALLGAEAQPDGFDTCRESSMWHACRRRQRTLHFLGWSTLGQRREYAWIEPLVCTTCNKYIMRLDALILMAVYTYSLARVSSYGDTFYALLVYRWPPLNAQSVLCVLDFITYMSSE